MLPENNFLSCLSWPFWNHTQQRLRTGWRLILQLGLFAGLTLLAGLLVSPLQNGSFNYHPFLAAPFKPHG